MPVHGSDAEELDDRRLREYFERILGDDEDEAESLPDGARHNALPQVCLHGPLPPSSIELQPVQVAHSPAKHMAKASGWLPFQ